MPAMVTDAASIANCFQLHSCYNQSFACVEKTTYDSRIDPFIAADISLVDSKHVVIGLTLAP